jgi:hypothetical protein
LADAPPLISWLRPSGGARKLCRNLRARAFLVGILY